MTQADEVPVLFFTLFSDNSKQKKNLIQIQFNFNWKKKGKKKNTLEFCIYPYLYIYMYLSICWVSHLPTILSSLRLSVNRKSQTKEEIRVG